MKKLRKISSLLFAVIIASLFAFSAFADLVHEGDFVFNNGDIGYEENGEIAYELVLFDGNDYEITIPTEVESKPIKYIMKDAFSTAPNLKKMTIKGDPVSFDGIRQEQLNYLHFFGCSRLDSIEVTDSTKYTSQDGVLYSKDMTTLYQYPAHKAGETFTVPSSVTTIAPYAFEDCKILKKVCFTDSVTSIGEKITFDAAHPFVFYYKGTTDNFYRTADDRHILDNNLLVEVEKDESFEEAMARYDVETQEWNESYLLPDDYNDFDPAEYDSYYGNEDEAFSTDYIPSYYMDFNADSDYGDTVKVSNKRSISLPNLFDNADGLKDIGKIIMFVVDIFGAVFVIGLIITLTKSKKNSDMGGAAPKNAIIPDKDGQNPALAAAHIPAAPVPDVNIPVDTTDTNPVPTAEIPAYPTDTNPVPTADIPAYPTDTNPVPTADIPAYPTDTNPVPTADIPAYPMDTNPVPTADIPAYPTDTNPVPTADIPAYPTDTNPVPTADIPAYPVDTNPVPAADIPAYPTDTNPVPTADIPAYPTDTNPVPTADIPAYPTDTNPVPTADIPAYPTDTNPVPTADIPAYPTDTNPVPTADIPAYPVDTNPVPTADIPAYPVDTNPVPAADIPAYPTDTNPVPTADIPAYPTDTNPVPTADIPAYPTDTNPVPTADIPAYPTDTPLTGVTAGTPSSASPNMSSYEAAKSYSGSYSVGANSSAFVPATEQTYSFDPSVYTGSYRNDAQSEYIKPDPLSVPTDQQ